MENITCAADLKIAIQKLELERDIQGELFKEDLFRVYENLKPLSILKNTLTEISSSQFLIDNVLGSSVGLLTGYLSKKITLGSTHNPLKKLLGLVLQFGVTEFIAKRPETVKSVGHFLISKIFHKHEVNTQKT
ncbi:MAG: hypothetical protein P4L34_12180 [Paludibacter sp.]|nr:hypothetical protein [Paludibacter sp.]